MTEQDQPAIPAGQRFLYWLSDAAKSAREGAKARPEAVAALTDTNIYKIKRFEAAGSMPRGIERIIAGYAEIAGLDDPREIYQTAIDLWYEHGSAPKVDGRKATTASEQFQQDLVPRGRPKADREPSRKTTSKPKRRAAQ